MRDLAQTREVTATDEKQKPLFSEAEKRDIIRAFITAYLRGEVEITLWAPDWTPEMKVVDYERKKIPNERKVEARRRFVDNVSIASGATPSTPEQLKNSVNSLFQLILWSRSGGLMKGEFL